MQTINRETKENRLSGKNDEKLRNFQNEEIVKLDDLEQHGRRENLEFEGISYEESENTADIVIKLVETLGVEI